VTPYLSPLDIPVSLGRDEARRRALAELAKAKYGGTPPWLEHLSDRASRLFSRIAELLGDLLAGPRPGGGGISWGFVIAVGAGLVVISLVVWRVGLPRWRRRRAGAEVQLDPTRGAADYRALAEQDAGRAEWAAAVRNRFRAVVRELEVRTVLDVRPARTAWEAAYSASRVLPEARDALHQGAEDFNAVTYGDRPADQESYTRMVAVDEQVARAAAAADLAADEPVPVP
jgi:hypothetical protein